MMIGAGLLVSAVVAVVAAKRSGARLWAVGLACSPLTLVIGPYITWFTRLKHHEGLAIVDYRTEVLQRAVVLADAVQWSASLSCMAALIVGCGVLWSSRGRAMIHNVDERDVVHALGVLAMGAGLLAYAAASVPNSLLGHFSTDRTAALLAVIHVFEWQLRGVLAGGALALAGTAFGVARRPAPVLGVVAVLLASAAAMPVWRTAVSIHDVGHRPVNNGLMVLPNESGEPPLPRLHVVWDGEEFRAAERTFDSPHDLIDWLPAGLLDPVLLHIPAVLDSGDVLELLGVFHAYEIGVEVAVGDRMGASGVVPQRLPVSVRGLDELLRRPHRTREPVSAVLRGQHLVLEDDNYIIAAPLTFAECEWDRWACLDVEDDSGRVPTVLASLVCLDTPWGVCLHAAVLMRYDYRLLFSGPGEAAYDEALNAE